MATNRESKIQILHSATAGSTPDVALLDYGELAINIADEFLYFKGSDDLLKTFAGGPTGATGTFTVYYSSTGPASPSIGDIWFHSDDGVYSIYINDGDSDQWVEITGKQGPTGSTGPSGSAGENGPTGPTGPSGILGNLSYTGLLEYPTNKTYRVDRYIVQERTFNFFYADCLTGGCSAELYAAGSTLTDLLSVTPTGVSASFSSVVSAGSTLSLVVSGITGGNIIQDFGFVVGYTQ